MFIGDDSPYLPIGEWNPNQSQREKDNCANSSVLIRLKLSLDKRSPVLRPDTHPADVNCQNVPSIAGEVMQLSGQEAANPNIKEWHSHNTGGCL